MFDQPNDSDFTFVPTPPAFYQGASPSGVSLSDVSAGFDIGLKALGGLASIAAPIISSVTGSKPQVINPLPQRVSDSQAPASDDGNMLMYGGLAIGCLVAFLILKK